MIHIQGFSSNKVSGKVYGDTGRWAWCGKYMRKTVCIDGGQDKWQLHGGGNGKRKCSLVMSQDFGGYCSFLWLIIPPSGLQDKKKPNGRWSRVNPYP